PQPRSPDGHIDLARRDRLRRRADRRHGTDTRRGGNDPGVPQDEGRRRYGREPAPTRPPLRATRRELPRRTAASRRRRCRVTVADYVDRADPAYGGVSEMSDRPSNPLMKAIVQQAYGSPGSLEVAEIPRPEPGDGELLVRVQA